MWDGLFRRCVGLLVMYLVQVNAQVSPWTDVQSVRFSSLINDHKYRSFTLPMNLEFVTIERKSAKRQKLRPLLKSSQDEGLPPFDNVCALEQHVLETEYVFLAFLCHRLVGEMHVE